MKKLSVFLCLLVLSFIFLEAQETDVFDWDWDWDSLFDEPFYDDTTEDEISEEFTADAAVTVLSSIKRRGITFSFSYEFQAGIAPGWDIAPWFFDGNEVFSWSSGAKMKSGIRLDAQVSEVFRVITVFNISIPDTFFSLGDFFFDYNILNAAFIRAGKYEHSWGISPNFNFTNLLSRVPSSSAGGDSYVFRIDVPIGVGGFQALALTRATIDNISRSDLGFGIKYNLAYRWADFDFGIFYQNSMATRGFLSIKTTLNDTEVYNEWLVAVNTHSDNNFSIAANIGFVREFLNRRLSLNGELFFNGEGNSYFYHQETDIKEANASPFIEGFNIALNMLYRFRGKGNPRFFMQMLYSPMQNSMQLVPGFRLSPFSNIDIYMAMPVALSSRSGYYYNNTADPNNRPFCITLLVTLSGNLQTGFYY